MSERHFHSFEDFWPHYVREHAKPETRWLHFAGMTAAMACVAGGLLTKRRWLLAVAPVVGYGAAWAGHWLYEGNQPTSFSHPLWSLRADFRMWRKMLVGAMEAEVERWVEGEPAAEKNRSDGAHRDASVMN
jgi:hypothetical protein